MKPTIIVERVLARYASLPLDEKMKALLLKLRKGADATLSLTQLFKVLALLGGWNVEEMVGAVPLHFDAHPFRLEIEDDEASGRAAYDKIKAFEVKSLPASPKLGHFYVMDLAPFKSESPHYAKDRVHHGADYRLWMGLPGYRIMDPHGKTFELLPTRYDLIKGSIRDQQQGLPAIDVKKAKSRLSTSDVLRWLKKDTSYVAQINETLGLEEHVPADQRTRDNTGTCAVCFRNIKLVQRANSKPLMALHGYNRPGHGYVVGRCWGGDHQPYELSCEATKIILKYSEEVVVARTKYLADLSSPTLKEFDEQHGWGGMTKPKMFIKSEVSLLTWTYKLEEHQKASERKVKQAEAERDVYKWLTDNWETRELPREGDKALDWFEIAARHVNKRILDEMEKSKKP